MKSRLTMDRAGRIVIPRAAREKLSLEAGASLELESVGDWLMLRPVRGTGPLAKERGVWVFRTGQALPAAVADDLLDHAREARGRGHLDVEA